MSSHRAVRLPSILFFAAALLAPAGASPSTIIGSLSDSVHPAIDEGLDIISASVEQSTGQLTFLMTTRGPIPTALPDPDDVMTYLWFVDTDENSGTGQPHGALGSEFNVRAVIGETYGGGFVDVTGGEPGGGTGTVSVDGSTISITIWLSQIGGASDFDWCCSSFGQIGGDYVPGNIETVIVHSDALPYTPPARVTVTTPILQLCPSGPSTGQLEVVIRDAGGNVLPNEEHVLTFHSTNEDVATVNGAGLVTALTLPEFHWQRPYVEVWADGLMADNAAVVRVTSADLGVVHEIYEAEHVALSLVPMIEGVNLDSLTAYYQVVEATERAYEAQVAGVGGVPTGGGTQYLVLDVADDPQTAVCGASGNPICLGWLWGQPQHNSCYIVNDPANRVPQWFVIFHEMGHNFTAACNSFNMFLWQPSQLHNVAYCEGIASLAALWSWKEIVASPAGLGPAAVSNINSQFEGSSSGFREALVNYQNAGADYEALDPDIVDGILMEMLDQHGLKAWFDLFSTFLPSPEPLPVALDTKEKQATWFVAAMSASCGQDLRGFFQSEYGFPIDEEAWPEISSVVEARVAGRTWTPVAVEELAGLAPPGDPLLTVAPNPFNPRTDVRFALPHAGDVSLAIYDVGGRRVRTLLSQGLPAGMHSASWDGCDEAGRRAASGVYVVRLVTPGGGSERKLVLLK
jgi:hypothetical protein